MNTSQVVSEVPLAAARGQVGSSDAPPAPGAPALARTRAAVRVQSIDVLRGLVSVLMALNHVPD